MDTEAPRYKQLSEPPKKTHQHEYDVVVSDWIVIRFCPDCGMAWKLESPYTAHLFVDEWVAIREPTS
jgi:hypothetical protein